jgi:hypothetical protein
LSPGRRTNRKNLRNCQRTIPFLLFIILESTKSARLYLIYFQSRAAHPQAGDRILCSSTKEFLAEGRRGWGFSDQDPLRNRVLRILQPSGACENLGKAVPEWESRNPSALRISWRGASNRVCLPEYDLPRLNSLTTLVSLLKFREKLLDHTLIHRCPVYEECL